MDSIRYLIQTSEARSDADFVGLALMSLLWADLARARGETYKADSVYALVATRFSADRGPYTGHERRGYSAAYRMVGCMACARRVDGLLAKGRWTKAFEVEEACAGTGCGTPDKSAHASASRALIACRQGNPDLTLKLLSGTGEDLVDALTSSEDLAIVLEEIRRECSGDRGVVTWLDHALAQSRALRERAWEDSVLTDADTSPELADAIENRRRIAEDLAELHEEAGSNEDREKQFFSFTTSNSRAGVLAAYGISFMDQFFTFGRGGSIDFSLYPRIRSLERQLAEANRRITLLLARNNR
ncbi:MAG TPA: hypothetical protein VGK89_06990 [Candidatus Eisenbacteria bacterium]